MQTAAQAVQDLVKEYDSEVKALGPVDSVTSGALRSLQRGSNMYVGLERSVSFLSAALPS